MSDGTRNEEVDAQIEALVQHGCSVLGGEEEFDSDRVSSLCQSLLMSGLERSEGAPLRARLEARIREHCREPAMHRGAEIKAVTDRIQREYDNLVRRESDQPTKPSGTAPANISSSTDK